MSSINLRSTAVPAAAALLIGFLGAPLVAAAGPEPADRTQASETLLAMEMGMGMGMGMGMDDMKKPDSTPKSTGMSGMGDNKMRGKQAPASAGSMPAASQDPMAVPANMDMMGRMRNSMPQRQGMNNMAANAGLPGFPGASHLYHVGASGFFLDHPQHIKLSPEQQANLNRIKEKAMLERSSADRRIEDAEQELWTLTASDAPDAAKIEAKVRAIETLRGDQRIAFIRSVGEAAKVLTSEQQAALLGASPMAASRAPAAAGKAPVTDIKAPMADPKPAPAAGMAPMKME